MACGLAAVHPSLSPAAHSSENAFATAPLSWRSSKVPRRSERLADPPPPAIRYVPAPPTAPLFFAHWPRHPASFFVPELDPLLGQHASKASTSIIVTPQIR